MTSSPKKVPWPTPHSCGEASVTLHDKKDFEEVIRVYSLVDFKTGRLANTGFSGWTQCNPKTL